MDKKIMLKKLLLILALSIPLFGQNITGTGTIGDPYVLYNPQDVDSIRYLGNGKFYALGNDIDFSTITGVGADTITGGSNKWRPLGILQLSLNGRGYAIKNLVITWDAGPSKVANMANRWGGFIGRWQFSVRNTDTVQNITFDGITAIFDSSITESGNDALYFGSIVGWVQGSNVNQSLVFNKVKVKNVVVWYNFGLNYTNGIGGFVGRQDYTTTKYIECGLDSSWMYVHANGGNIPGVNFGAITGNNNQISGVYLIETYVKNNYFNLATTGTTGANETYNSLILGFTAYDILQVIEDCYFFNNTFVVEGTNNAGSDGYYFGQFAAGATDIIGTPRGYFGKTNLTITGVPLVTDQIGWFLPNTDNNLENFASVYVDTTGKDTVKIVGDNTSNWSAAPTLLDSSLMIIESSFPNLSFGDIWALSPKMNDNYPFLLSELGEMQILTPSLNDVYQATDTINITWGGTVDTVNAYYSTNNGVTWIFVDTLTSYAGILPVLNIAFNGTVLIKITDKDNLFENISQPFTTFASKSIEILYPLSSLGQKSVGDTVHIDIKTVLVDEFNLFYSVNDSVSWIPLVYGLTPINTANVTTYVWTLPNIHGAIYLLATENKLSDTVDVVDRSSVNIGTNFPSQPAICWYYLGGSILETRRYIDRGCEWIAGANLQRSTTYISDYGNKFDEITSYCYYPNQYSCVENDVLTSGYIWLQAGLDINQYTLDEFYAGGDTVIYKFRRYYVGTDSIFYCDDLINEIDSLVINDLHDEFTDWTSFPKLKVYNVQRSKLQGDTTAADIDFESLNDPLFIPLILLYGDAANGRGKRVYTIPLLEEPIDFNAASDMVLLFSSLNITRDYFRGIDPKARKSGR